MALITCFLRASSLSGWVFWGFELQSSASFQLPGLVASARRTLVFLLLLFAPTHPAFPWGSVCEQSPSVRSSPEYCPDIHPGVQPRAYADMCTQVAFLFPRLPRLLGKLPIVRASRRRTHHGTACSFTSGQTGFNMSCRAVSTSLVITPPPPIQHGPCACPWDMVRGPGGGARGCVIAGKGCISSRSKSTV